MTCGLCQKQYVGKTEQTLRQRFQNLEISILQFRICRRNALKQNLLETIRHYGHRREIETLSSPLGRHFGETALDLFKALLTSLCKSTRMLPQGKVAVMTTGNFKSSTRWTKASLDSWGRGEQTFEDKSLLQKTTSTKNNNFSYTTHPAGRRTGRRNCAQLEATD